MTENKNKLKIDPRYLIGLGIFLVCVVMANASSSSIPFFQEKTEVISSENFLGKTEDFSDGPVIQNIKTQSQDDWNVIQNMINGDITWVQAKNRISDNKYWAGQRVGLNTVEMKVNRRYIDYLNTGLDVIFYYSNYGKDSEHLKKEFELFEIKKELI